MPHPFFLAQARRLLAILLAGGLPYALAAEPVSPPAAPTEAVARSGHATYHQGVAAAIAPLLAQPLTLDAASRIGLLNSPQTQQVWADFGITPHDLLLAGVLKLPAPLALVSCSRILSTSPCDWAASVKYRMKPAWLPLL